MIQFFILNYCQMFYVSWATSFDDLALFDDVGVDDMNGGF